MKLPERNENAGEMSRWEKIIFPLGKGSQLLITLFSLLVVIIGALLGNLTQVWNLNLLAPLVAGYFFGTRIHPVIAVGPAVVTLIIMGISWIIALALRLTDDPELAIGITQGGLNVFLAMTAGSLAQLAYQKLVRKRSAE